MLTEPIGRPRGVWSSGGFLGCPRDLYKSYPVKKYKYSKFYRVFLLCPSLHCFLKQVYDLTNFIHSFLLINIVSIQSYHTVLQKCIQWLHSNTDKSTVMDTMIAWLQWLHSKQHSSIVTHTMIALLHWFLSKPDKSRVMDTMIAWLQWLHSKQDRS